MLSTARPILASFLLGALALTACSPAGSGGSAALPQAASPAVRAATSPGTYIKHVVIIIQENRSFDNLFAGFKGADTTMSGTDSHGNKVNLQATSFNPGFDPDMNHNFGPAVIAYDNGKMDQFDLTQFDNGQPAGAYAYTYIERSQTQPYWTMAQTYTLADHMFPTEFGPSFTSHLNLIAGTDQLKTELAEANYPAGQPWGCDGGRYATTFTVNGQRIVSNGPTGPAACFTQFNTLADSLDAKHVSWKYYAPSINASGFSGGQLWSSFDAIAKVRCGSYSGGTCNGYGADWKNVISPQTTVLADAKAGRLPAVSWVIPDWQDSDHPAAMSDTGPSWVSSVVNAIGKGPDWKSTAIFLLWDDWGGWYDNAVPPTRDYRGLGIRVPMIVISPYARHAHVASTQYESASILRFVEETFGLSPIGPVSAGYTDQRAASPAADCFDFTQTPLKFVPIAAKYPASFFLTRPPSHRAPDDQ